MTNLLLLATLMCPIQLPPGHNMVDITAKYYHEEPAGEQYVYHGSEYAIAMSWPQYVAAEGHPWHVSAVVNGLQVANCSGQDALLISGFESGDTGDWN